jgi:nucleoside-diphosphate-sugar epimerase
MLSSHQISLLDASIEALVPHLDLRSLGGQRLFITGGTGFFGLWLLSALRVLRSQGIGLQACVLSRNPSAFLTRHPQFRDQPWLSFVSGNVRDFEIPEQPFDLMLHAATETSTTAHADPVKMFDDIVFGTRRVLQMARSSRVKRILLISSGAVYGPQPPQVTHQPDDSQMACDPWLVGSAYGEGKRVMELMGGILQRDTGIECLSARCFAFCGPGLPLDGHFAVGNFIRDALYGSQITVHGDGTPKRSYLYGADLAMWLLYLLVKGQSGTSYNVGSDEALSIKQLAFTVRDLLSPNTPVKVLQNPDVIKSMGLSYVPSISRARSIGCRQWTSLTESLVLTANFYKKDWQFHT